MTLEQINELTVTQVQDILGRRLRDKSEEINAINLEAELDLYKQELIAEENARIAEANRIRDIKERWSAMPDIRLAFNEIGSSVANPAIELKRIIAEDDQQMLSDLETAYVVALNKIAEERSKNAIRENGKMARECCFEILDVIAGWNIQRNLTKEQKDNMVVTFAQPLQALQVYRPGLAKSLIEEITPDNDLVTNEMKEDILSVFTKYNI